MTLFIKLVAALALLAVAAFCGFGLLATFEPGISGALAWRVGYAAAGLACLAGTAWLLFQWRPQ